MPDEMLAAKIALIFKKGDSTKMENYRPISLLNSMYKILAAITQRRLAEGIDEFLHKTQFGFRKNRSVLDCHFSKANFFQSKFRGTRSKAFFAKKTGFGVVPPLGPKVNFLVKIASRKRK